MYNEGQLTHSLQNFQHNQFKCANTQENTYSRKIKSKFINVWHSAEHNY